MANTIGSIFSCNFKQQPLYRLYYECVFACAGLYVCMRVCVYRCVCLCVRTCMCVCKVDRLVLLIPPIAGRLCLSSPSDISINRLKCLLQLTLERNGAYLRYIQVSTKEEARRSTKYTFVSLSLRISGGNTTTCVP